MNSSRNAQKHGLLSRDLVISGECREEFDLLFAGLQGELRPVGLLENTLVERIAVTIWRQKRLIRAESAGIDLRTAEKFGQVVLEFRNYLTDGAKIQDAQSALESEVEDSVWLQLLEEVEGFDAAQPNALQVFAKECPAAFEYLEGEAARVRYPVMDYLRTKHINLAGFIVFWKRFVESQRATKLIAALFRESRKVPQNPEIVVRYQSALDNELYKAMRALRDAQTYRLSSLEPASNA